ncbi:class I SAM-dependent methyltransferase [Sphingobium scionense]|uniref:Uncharacterized protein n=1 Tax=Sphingobium scionense TaxID=1404341 RepID=A0A7W6PWT1_9SPHN|nr:class I SAM-dependent methyltransferase [Sphingobium scionense]MBB4148587.1 hypothetical protein [Sphingobium scionense]
MTAKQQRHTAARLHHTAEHSHYEPGNDIFLHEGSAPPMLQAELPVPLTSRAIFWQPRHDGGEGSMLHLPFLFWLIEDSRPVRIVQIGLAEPVRFLSLCQAVDKLGLEALCMGIVGEGQSWAGKPAEQQATLYGDFSFVTTEDVARATRHAHEQQVDLLVVDMSLTDELMAAVRTHWAPLLSDRAIIVIHDPENNSAGVEARQYFDGLVQDRPSIAFSQSGPGLQIILHGRSQSERLLKLANLKLGMPGYLLARQVFSRLGQGLENAQTARRADDSVKRAKKAADAVQQKLAELEVALAREAKDKAAARAAEQEQVALVAELQAALFDLEKKARDDEHVSACEGEAAGETLREELAEAQALTRAQGAELEAARAARLANAQKREKLEKLLKVAEEEKAALVAERDSARADQKKAEDALLVQAEEQDERRKEAYRKRDDLARKLESAQQKMDAFSSQRDAQGAQIQALEKGNAELSAKLKALVVQADEQASRRKDAHRKRDEALHALDIARQENGGLKEQIGKLEAQVRQSQAKRLAIWQDFETLNAAYDVLQKKTYQAEFSSNGDDVSSA